MTLSICTGSGLGPETIARQVSCFFGIPVSGVGISELDFLQMLILPGVVQYHSIVNNQLKNIDSSDGVLIFRYTGSPDIFMDCVVGYCETARWIKPTGLKKSQYRPCMIVSTKITNEHNPSKEELQSECERVIQFILTNKIKKLHISGSTRAMGKSYSGCASTDLDLDKIYYERVEHFLREMFTKFTIYQLMISEPLKVLPFLYHQDEE